MSPRHTTRPAGVRPADLPERPAPGVALACSCGVSYSATRGDYFTLAPDHTFMCECGRYLRLLRKETRYVAISSLEAEA
jgi:hypothetical protein